MDSDRPAAPSAPLPPASPERPAWHYPAAAWLATAVLFGVLAFLAAFYDRFPGDEGVADAFQGWDIPALGGFLAFVNAFGAEWLYVALIAGIVLALGLMRAGWESMMVLYTLIPRAANGVLKDWVERPRPSDDLVQVTEHASGFSYPSGHTVGTAALFLVLFLALPVVVRNRPLRWLLQAGCALLFLAAGPARVYVGAHWPSDVLAGYLLALLLLGPPLYVYLTRRSPPPNSMR